MKLIVPDASVILKWVLPSDTELDAASALQIRDAAIAGKLTLRVPSLWIYEVGNILSRNFPAHAPALVESLLAFGLTEGGGEHWRRQAFELTQAHQVTFYDAAYHALALVEKGTFVTADAKYFAKARQAGAIAVLSEFDAGTR